MTRCRVKICGITSVGDALGAVEAGADAVGLVFAPSPRRISEGEASRIAGSLPPFIAAVGVFVNEKAETVRALAECCRLAAVQLHGEETPEYCESLRALRVVKAVRVRDASAVSGLDRYRGVCALLLDSYDPSIRGGTGKTFDWVLAGKVGSLGIPLILSGGLNEKNVGEAIRTVRPFAVDVSSGVESSPGKKDIEKVKRFVRAVELASECA